MLNDILRTPMAKRVRAEKTALNISTIDEMLSSGLKTISERLTALEVTVQRLFDLSYRHQCCDEVLNKLNNIEDILQRPQVISPTMINNEIINYENDDSTSNLSITQMMQPSTSLPIVLVNNQKPNQVTASLGLDSTVQVVTLNSEDDYIEGTWLGDENNADTRVRCPISPGNLRHINMTTSPEKMAIKLLDYLFPQEVLAVSNLSGKGKHGKQQLDPLMVYGIRCHLMLKFKITEGHWFKIKQNIDSKCRTAWRKKSQGLPLATNRRKQNSISENIDSLLDSHQNQLHELVSDGESIFVTSETLLSENSDDDLDTKMIQMTDGDIKVLHATPEQLLRLQQRHHYRVFSNDHLLPQVLEENHVFCEDDRVIEDGEQMLAIVDVDEDVDVDVDEMENEYVNVEFDSDHGDMVSDQDLQLIEAANENNDNDDNMECSLIHD